MADNIGEEARDGALTQTNQSIADESVVDDLTEGENSEDDQVEDGQSSLNDLLLGMAEDKQPSEAGLDKLHSMLSLMDKKQVNAQDVDGKSALQIAVKHGLVTAANALINAGAEVSEKDTKGRQHLHKACLEGYTGMVKLLLEKGADIEAKQHRQATPLDEACWMGHIDVVDILLDKNANTQVTDEDRWSPLYSASRYGHEQVVRRLLLADKSNLDATATYHRWTALHAATFHGHEGAVSALLENGARLDIKDNNERTPLMTAILQRHSNITRKLLIRRSNEEDTQLETIDKSRRTPLISASLNGFLDGAVQLIAAGANCNAQSVTSKSTPLIAAASWRFLKIVQALLEAKGRTNVNIQDKDGSTALHTACSQCHIKIMPLHLASHQGNEYIVKLLLEAGAPVDAADKDGKTALHLASGARAKNPSQRTVNQLGADGLTPEERHKAEFQSGRYAAVDEILLKHGANPGIKTNRKETTLHLAASRGDRSRLDPILKSMDRGDMSSRNNQGRTALYLAFKGSRPETAMRALLASERLEAAEFGRNEIEEDALKWAAKDPETHDIATWLMLKWPRTRGGASLLADLAETERPGKFPVEGLGGHRRHSKGPPFAQMYRDSKKYQLPRPSKGLSSILESFEATVVQFYKGPGESGTIRRYRPVQQVIYDLGPAHIMKTTISDLRGIISSKSDLSDSMMYLKTEPRFTWVHLPATNVSVALRMLDWVEVPDRTSSSRTMRPRAMVRLQDKVTDRKRHKDKNKEESKSDKTKEGGKKKDGGERMKSSGGRVDGAGNGVEPKEDGFVAASAIYMPYFCFSSQCQDETSSQGDAKDKNRLQRLLEAKESYKGLLGAYESSAIHGSTTLDEWYYHFADDGESAGDQKYRNKNQVVTKFLMLWVWTIANKWLITATSCSFDDNHDTLVEEILAQLSKQAEYGGSASQPGSVADMSRLIVDYCVGAYERRPTPEGQVSSRQVFSNYMNQIGRKETTLFDDFTLRTQSWQQQTESNGEEKPKKHSSTDEAAPKPSPDDEIRNAIKKAERLYCDIKDVRDELNILKSAAQYQHIVQMGLSDMQTKDADLTAAYVVNDLKEVDIVADRIQSAVNTTLSLQQSEIANLQASLATEQGKILMVFTFNTLLFLPLSFLSSLFALDVASFEQAPGWAFAVS
ncbi:hypothetical protein ACJZ2D_011816 [Fusarium nematophilum]